MNVVFVEPAFPPTQRHFVRALAAVGATVVGIGERPAEWLDEELRSWMPHYHHVPTVVDAGVLTDAVRHVRQARLGEWVIDAHLPPTGTPTQPVEAGYWANVYVRMRHPDYDVLRGLLDDVGRSVHVRAG